MKIDLNNHEFSIVWDGVYYKALKDYPNINQWELKSIQEFIRYEHSYDRSVVFEVEDESLKKSLNSLLDKEYSSVLVPEKISECTACKQEGCLTKYLCHTASYENAKKIISSDKLLSAIKWAISQKSHFYKKVEMLQMIPLIILSISCFHGGIAKRVTDW